MTRKLIQAAGLYPGVPYSYAAVTASGSTVFTAGACPIDAHGAVVAEGGTMIHGRNFADVGRHLHTLARIGPEASPGLETEAWRILDSLDLDPDYRPSWRASG